MSTSSGNSGSAEAVELYRVDIYLQHNQRLSSGTASANDFVADNRSLLIGFSNASLQMYSWQAKVSSLHETCHRPYSVERLVLASNAA